MARKAKAAPQYVEPDSDGSSNHGRHMPATKTEAVQMAIAAGFDSPQIGAGYIQSQFGMDVSPQHFSSTKSQLKSRILAGKAAPKLDDTRRKAEPKNSSNGEADLLTVLETMKPLVEQLGAEKVKKLVDLLG